MAPPPHMTHPSRTMKGFHSWQPKRVPFSCVFAKPSPNMTVISRPSLQISIWHKPLLCCANLMVFLQSNSAIGMWEGVPLPHKPDGNLQATSATGTWRNFLFCTNLTKAIFQTSFASSCLSKEEGEAGATGKRAVKNTIAIKRMPPPPTPHHGGPLLPP